MTERRPDNTPESIERALLDLGRDLNWPAEPNLLPSVRQRLANQPAPTRSRLSWRLSQPRLVLPAAAVLVLVATILTLSESTRLTVADRLGLPGVSISTDPTATVSPGGALAIGDSTSLDEAIARTGGDIVLPPEILLGPPDGIYVLDDGVTIQVTYVYRPTVDIPGVKDTGVGLLISQFDGETNESFIQKQLGPQSIIEATEVNDQPAFWLTGAPHVFYYERPDGTIAEESIRLAANVLLWEQDGKTLRIETALDHEAAARIAESMAENR